MNVLLLRPVPANERFGLGPFFRIEPLGMEYIAAALEARGHRVTLADLRFRPSLAAHIRRSRPALVGIAAMHALETDEVVALAERVRALLPDVPIVVGGHTAAAYPEPFLVPAVTAVVLDDGERAMPADLRRARRRRAARRPCPVWRCAIGTRACFERGAKSARWCSTRSRCRRVTTSNRGGGQYACLAHRPAWLVETARGCPFRCSFCSIWQVHARTVRERSIDSVCRDFASVGDHVFVADDLFWHHPPRSLELAHELRRRGVRKKWILVQSRTDLVARHPELLEAWRPLAKDFDIFFGLEAATNEGLEGLRKDATVDETARGVAVARATRVRRDRKLRHRSGLDRAGLRTPLGICRAAPAVPGGVHDPDAAPGHGVFRGDAAHAAGAALVPFRHAPPALGARARVAPLLRAVLRDLAPFRPESQRTQGPSRSGCARWIWRTPCFWSAPCAARNVSWTSTTTWASTRSRPPQTRSSSRTATDRG